MKKRTVAVKRGPQINVTIGLGTMHANLSLQAIFFFVQESWRFRFQLEDEEDALAKALERSTLEAQKESSCSRQVNSSSQPLDENTVKQNENEEKKRNNDNNNYKYKKTKTTITTTKNSLSTLPGVFTTVFTVTFPAFSS